MVLTETSRRGQGHLKIDGGEWNRNSKTNETKTKLESLSLIENEINQYLDWGARSELTNSIATVAAKKGDGRQRGPTVSSRDCCTLRV